MTFKDDMQADIADIIDDTDEFGTEAIHTPQGGVAQPAFNCLIGESILHGDDEMGTIDDESIAITVITDEVTAVKIRDSITVNGTPYEVVNAPFTDSETSGTSVIELRRDRLNETLI